MAVGVVGNFQVVQVKAENGIGLIFRFHNAVHVFHTVASVMNLSEFVSIGAPDQKVTFRLLH